MTGEVSWYTSDINNLMTTLHLTKVDSLDVEPHCKLRPSPPSAPPTSRINVGVLLIQASLSINTLVPLLSLTDMRSLCFASGCQVLDMPGYSPPSNQVSHCKISHCINRQ